MKLHQAYPSSLFAVLLFSFLEMEKPLRITLLSCN